MNFKQRWTAFATAFNEKAIRERMLILATLLALLYLLWDFVFAQAMNQKRAEIEQRFSAAKAELKKLSAEEQVYVKVINNNASAGKQRELASLEKQLQKLNMELQSLSVGLLPAHLLPKVLHDVLDKTVNLKLVSLSKGRAQELLFQGLPAVELPNANEHTGSDAVELNVIQPAVAGVFKHSVVIRLKGSFFQVRDFLHRLEDLEWKFYWDSLDYQVDVYPRALVTLEIYTLSTEKGFLGG